MQTRGCRKHRRLACQVRLRSREKRRDKQKKERTTQMINNNNNNKHNNRYNNNTINDSVVLQVTLFDTNNKHKPISTLIQVESLEFFNNNSKEVKTKAIQNICNKRLLSGKELVKLGYTRIKVRNYSLLQRIKRGE